MPRPQLEHEGHPPLYQIWITERHPVHGKRDMPIGPRMCREYLAPIMEMIGKRIASGIEKTSRAPWSNPRLVLCETTLHPDDSPFTREDRQNELVGGYRAPASATPSLILN